MEREWWMCGDLRWSKLWIIKVFVNSHYWWTCVEFGMKTLEIVQRIIGARVQWRTRRMDPKIGEDHTRPLLSIMVISPTIRGLLLWGFLVVVVANPLLSQLRSFVTSVAGPTIFLQIVRKKTWPVSTADKRAIFKETTCRNLPFDGRARGCVFQGSKMCGVATNVYSRKTSEKTRKGVVYEL